MWGWTSVAEGDWVKVQATVPVTFSDHLTGSGIKKGTRGVVTSIGSGRAEVRFDTGLGGVSAWVPTRHLSVVRRGGGVAAFNDRITRLSVARAALIVFLSYPVWSFVIMYGWVNKGFDGITVAFALGVVQSIGDWMTMFVSAPVKTIVWVGFLWVLALLAWR
jgi:hypothetical protein